MSAPSIMPPFPVPVRDTDTITALSHLGVIHVQGDDAAAFIHSQLSTDFTRLDAQQARLAAFCSAKGRMQASFIGLTCADGLLLLCHRSLLQASVQRLRMFVLRAKCRLHDATACFALYGLLGAPAHQYMGPETAPWQRRDQDGASIVQLYPAWGQPRALYLASESSAAPEVAGLAASDDALWQYSEIASGVATLSAPVVDAFVPQMLNYESVGGVDFKKGCWPGQEVVARSQFRGTLKRRAFIVHAPQSLCIGMEVFAPHDATQNVGTVVQAAAAPGQAGWGALVCLQTAAAQQPLFAHPALGADEQARLEQAVPLQLHRLPYALREDL